MCAFTLETRPSKRLCFLEWTSPFETSSFHQFKIAFRRWKSWYGVDILPSEWGPSLKSRWPTLIQILSIMQVKVEPDFLDIYLGAKCRFYICPASGIMAIPTLFRRPIVTVNFVPMCAVYLGYPGQLIIPKKLWLRDERRFLTFPETIRFEKIWLIENDRPVPFGLQYARNGIDVIENTGEEIAAVALEMDERLKGTWETTKEDEELQNRVWSLFESSALKSNGEYLTRLGAEFLRQNQYLLD